jgi:hypothetical protein
MWFSVFDVGAEEVGMKARQQKQRAGASQGEPIVLHSFFRFGSSSHGKVDLPWPAGNIDYFVTNVFISPIGKSNHGMVGNDVQRPGVCQIGRRHRAILP